MRSFGHDPERVWKAKRDCLFGRSFGNSLYFRSNSDLQTLHPYGSLLDECLRVATANWEVCFKHSNGRMLS